MDDLIESAIDTVMRCAFNIRREIKQRPATNAEVAILVRDEALRAGGWDWVGGELIAPAGVVGTPVAWMHVQGNHMEPSLRELDDCNRTHGWTQFPLYGNAGVSSSVPPASEARQMVEGVQAELRAVMQAHVRLGDRMLMNPPGLVSGIQALQDRLARWLTWDAQDKPCEIGAEASCPLCAGDLSKCPRYLRQGV